MAFAARTLAVVATLALFAPGVIAAAPPTTVNYQGVLRNASDKPLTGSYDVAFRFYDALSGGNQILIDTHAAAGSGAVVVMNGLFNAMLGGGTVTDGTGAGTYTNLVDVFRDFAAVYLEIRVGTETLSPRVKVQSSAYALNATNLNGRAASGYVDTSATRQIKNGTFRFETADPATAVLDVVSDPGSPQAMWVQKGGNVCKLQDGSSGIDCTAPAFGVKASGATGGGYFAEASGNSALYAGSSGFGANGIGSSGGAYFSDTGGSSAYAAHSGNGVEGYGPARGGWFKSTGNAGEAMLATNGGYAVLGNGTSVGGYFSNGAGGGSDYTYAGYSGYGIRSSGSSMGGFLSNNAGSGYSYVGYNAFGIQGYGTFAGGYFKDNSYGGYSYVGYNGYGIQGYGSNAGGMFQDTDDGATAYAGSNRFGIWAQGPNPSAGQAGYFSTHSGTAYAILGTDSDSPYGGPFGIKAVVDSCCDFRWSGDFINLTNGVFARLAYGLGYSGYQASISGNAAKNFVQNHPYDATKLIAYSSLEGDEVGTYTRGSGRLVNGEAHVALGETFQWVTNPDVGLTAQVTARGSAAVLYVEALSTTELVVRSASGDPNAAFDFAVNGLRLGFEESPVVSDRTEHNEAKLPSVSGIEQELAKRPDLLPYTPLSRFRKMAVTAGFATATDDMARGRALRRAIGEYDRERDGRALAGSPVSAPVANPASAPGEPASPSGASRPAADSVDRRALAAPTNSIPVEIAGSAAAGDVLTLDPDGGAALRVATVPADPAVVGIVAAEPGTMLSGSASIALAGSIVRCRVDAAYGAIAPGDLLVTSATPGCAMRAGDGPREGRVVAKALEAWPAGTGVIRVLVMAR